MKTFTKYLGAACALGLGLGLVSTGAMAQEKIKIGVSIPAATHGWAGGLNWHAEQAEKRIEATYPNIDVIVVSANGATEQANDLEDLVSVQNIDALVVLPFESDPLTVPVQQVKEAGKFVTVVDRGLSLPGIEDVYVAGNNPELGRVSGEYIRKRLDDEGKIVILRGIPTTVDTERVDAFIESIEGSNIEVLDMKHANWNRDDGYEVMQDFLSRFPQIDAVWAQDDDIALGVIEAVKQADRTDEMFIVGGAGMKDIIKRVMDGDKLTPIDVLYPPAMIATAMELTALKFTSSIPVEGRYILGATVITQENAKNFYFPDSPF
ncbi:MULTISPECIES: ABC transporter substrate-binding protein [Thalassospira]|mgnify:FL=1|uniref:ABC transporter substrate-binding protein n=1 Tax=Thalassospira lucentensis TaxID=168935 RepID=A0A358HZ47_9PROT|nr:MULTISPECIES: ABC transporter substrate-binding protein [Thalassospira]MBV16365.1 ABC transporter substrate-binding protein [Thalassospira sp.]HBV00466.1 ABC transporter substrate-binding protein [Thalassospira lucentensis]HCW66429.1 ABC transporter substrate-binding protein [Thalassospira lucentensis]|tara:strand:- start:568 stop:1530 length:963 start_codon:yes stop_codon:yes gene_type:complete